jgi:FkbM family methyltransferase
MTSILSRRVGKNGRVIAFEAHPAIAEKLRSNASRWLRNNIQIVEAAVSKVGGVLTMQDWGDGSTNEGTAQIRSNDSSTAEGRCFEVRAVSLDGEFHGSQFAVIKIDVEGHELAVLEGATRLLEQRAVRDIIFESTKHYPSLVHRFLLQHGFSVFRLESGIFGPKLIDPKKPSNGLELLADFVATTEPKRALKRFSNWGWKTLSRQI